MKAIQILVLVVLAVVIVMAAYLSHEQEKTKSKVIYAGSLIVPFAEIEKRFESQHPGVDVQMGGHGSIQAIRHVTDLHDCVDVVVVADETLIPDMMYPDYADWYVRFATNRMVVAYTDESRYAGVINDSNWYEILPQRGVTVGFSNPMLDACGYRTLMVAQLAEGYYGNTTIFDDLIACNFDPPVSVEEVGGVSVVLVPEILEPRTEKIVIRGGSVQLLALLDLGEIDYAFMYKSMAEQHGLRYLELPAEIDLGFARIRGFLRKGRSQARISAFHVCWNRQGGKTDLLCDDDPEERTTPETCR